MNGEDKPQQILTQKVKPTIAGTMRAVVQWPSQAKYMAIFTPKQLLMASGTTLTNYSNLFCTKAIFSKIIKLVRLVVQFYIVSVYRSVNLGNGGTASLKIRHKWSSSQLFLRVSCFLVLYGEGLFESWIVLLVISLFCVKLSLSEEKLLNIVALIN